MPLDNPLPLSAGSLPVDTANADADADFAKALVGMLVNARMSAFRVNTSDWGRISTDLVSIITSEAHNTNLWARVSSALFGRDTSDNTMRAIEARGSSNSEATSVYRLLTSSLTRGFDPLAAVFDAVQSLREVSGTAGGALAMLDQRASGYWSCRQGRRFMVTSEGTAITVSNGFTATTPRMTIEAGATNEALVRRAEFTCLVAGTTNLQVRIVLDPDSRYSSGGTAVTLGARTNLNGASANNASFTAHYGAITATATDADEREIYYGTIVNATGNRLVLEWEDGLIIPASGTLLIYLMDAGAAGTIAANVTLEDVNVQ